MTTSMPEQRPEGRLIEQAAKADGRSVRKLAANAGMSDTRWHQIVKGWQPGGHGEPRQVIAQPIMLARMALTVGVDAGQLIAVGRPDAAAELVYLLDSGEGSVVPLPATVHGTTTVAGNGAVQVTGADEIDMIYASNMPAREKLLRIRQVLELRAQAEAEEALGRKTAPAQGAEAESSDA